MVFMNTGRGPHQSPRTPPRRILAMLSLTRKQATVPPVADLNPGGGNGLADDETSAASVALGQHVQAFDHPIQVGETRRGHSRRMARRTRLHGYALLAVALFAFVIALAAANTAH